MKNGLKGKCVVVRWVHVSGIVGKNSVAADEEHATPE